jgi:hypothetical protein
MAEAPRVREQSTPVQGAQRAVRLGTSAASLPTPAARLLWLQATAGNRAVTDFLELQRDPAPLQTAELTLADRIATARDQVTKGQIDAPAFEHYRASSTGSVAEVTELLWDNEMGLADIDRTGAGIDKKTDKKMVVDFQAFLQNRATKALTTKLRELTKQVGTSGAVIKDQVDAIFKESPMWEEGKVTDRLFVEWVGPVPVSKEGPAGAKDLWQALRNASGASVASGRAGKLSKTAVSAMDAAEIGAVKNLLDVSTTWVVTPEDTDVLTDNAAAALGRPTDRTDSAWKQLRDRMSTLILVAESDLINATVPQSKKIPLIPQSWATFRDRYIATITKPMWTFYRDNIVDADILGEKVKASTDSSGVHRDVAAVLPLLEESAMRLGGFGTKADLIKANQRPGSEFRFEAMSHPGWMWTAKHMSFHGTGRAMDFRAAKNPDFKGPTHELVSILGDGELSELSAGSKEQRLDLQTVAAHDAGLVQQRAALQARLAAATDDQDKAQLQDAIARIEANLRDSVSTDATVKRVRSHAAETHAEVKRIEANFLRTWATITLMRKFPLGDAAAALMIAAKVDAAAQTANQALEAAVKANSPKVATLRDRVRRIEEVRALLKDPKASINETNQKQMLDKVQSLSKSGLTDMPSWMVQAFAERGWQWGMWSGFADAMHFDYMGPVADVRSDAQYL